MRKKTSRRRLSAIRGRKRKNPATTVAAIRTAGLLSTAYSLLPNGQKRKFLAIIGRGRNPAGKRKRVQIYARCLPFRIFAVKGKSSMYPGTKWQHKFTNAGAVYGNPDGSITIAPANRSKPLWGHFKQ